MDSPDHCPAARRAQVQRFSDSDELDACPKLRGRPEGAMSAMCVPVSIMGRSVGVIHVTGEQHTSFSENTEQDLATLAKLSGARIGLLRVMAETQLQATTDSLTGLLNRRSFEHRVATLRREESDVTIAMADLDHFKLLNDTYGHGTGDRALRLFAQVLGESLRTEDVVCRHGGEEFAIAVPGCSHRKGARDLRCGADPPRGCDCGRRAPEVHRELRGRRVRPHTTIFPLSSAGPTPHSSKPSAKDATGSSSSTRSGTRPRHRRTSEAPSNGHGRVFNGRDTLEMADVLKS